MRIFRCEQAGPTRRDAYGDGAISLPELKIYRADIHERRAALQAQLQALEIKDQALQQQLDQADALIEYCRRVRENLKTFSVEEKQLAFDALALRVTFMPRSPLHIEAWIPVVSEFGASWCVALTNTRCGTGNKGRIWR